MTAPDRQPVVTFHLYGRRGIIVGTVIHSNPNYSVVLTAAGNQEIVPGILVERVTREEAK